MLTPHCSAVSGMVAPSSTAPITRARKSSEYGFAIHAGLLPAGSLNHIRAGMGIPLRFSLFGKRSKEHNTGHLPSTLREAAFERATVQILDKLQGHSVVGVLLFDC